VLGRHFAQHVAAAIRRAHSSGERDAAMHAAMAALAAVQRSRSEVAQEAESAIETAICDRVSAVEELDRFHRVLGGVARAVGAGGSDLMEGPHAGYGGGTEFVAEPGVVATAGVAARLGLDSDLQLEWLGDAVEATIKQEGTLEL